MKYLLDSNVVISLIRGENPALARRIRRHQSSELAISAIVSHELYYGAFKSAKPPHNAAIVEGLQFQVLDFDREDARHAGEIRAGLALRGTPVGPLDVLIAGQARARKLVLVTNNTREFARIPGLKIEDWSSR
jgi:tRNA(fMet)-specific endonuclease VapC